MLVVLVVAVLVVDDGADVVLWQIERDEDPEDEEAALLPAAVEVDGALVSVDALLAVEVVPMDDDGEDVVERMVTPALLEDVFGPENSWAWKTIAKRGGSDNERCYREG